jgi:hypothetical protein
MIWKPLNQGFFGTIMIIQLLIILIVTWQIVNIKLPLSREFRIYFDNRKLSGNILIEKTTFSKYLSKAVAYSGFVEIDPSHYFLLRTREISIKPS